MKNAIKVLLILAMLLTLSSFILVNAASAATLNVVPFTLGKLGSATAQWSSAQAHSGSSSVNLKTTVALNDYAYLTFDPLAATIDDVTSLSFYYYHVSDNLGSGPRIGILINNSGTCYLAVSGAASTSIGTWKKANGVTGGNLTTYDANLTKVWWYGTCNCDGSGYSQVGGPVSFSNIKSSLNGNIEHIAVYMGVVDGVNVGNGEAYVDDVEVNGVIHYGSIQDAVDAAGSGDTVNVAAGVYNEQVTINKNNLIVQSADGATNTIIDPTDTANGGVVIDSNGVIFDGFKIRDYSDETYENKIIRINGNNSVIKNNILQGNLNQGGISDQTEYGVLIYGSGNLIEGNEIYDIGYIGVNIVGEPYSSASNNRIIGNKIHDIGIYGIAVDRSRGNIIKQNEISNLVGGTLWGDVYDPLTWCWGVIVWGANSTGTIIDNQDLMNLPNGIVLSATQNVTVKNSEIAYNNKTGIKLADSSWVPDTAKNNSLIHNKIHNNSDGIVVKGGGLGGVGINNSMNWNNIYNNTANGVINYVAQEVNAENNWWGAANGPSGVGPGSGDAVSINVDYTPWLTIMSGIVINGESVTPTTLFNYSDAWLNATVSVNVPEMCELDRVWIMGNWTSAWLNYTVVNHDGSKYYYLVDSSFLDNGETVSWKYYANSTCGDMEEGAWQSFTLKKRTQLITTPPVPDGYNGWFVTLPCFTLVADPSATNSSYAWWFQLPTYHKYTAPFCFDWNSTRGGLERLHYFSSFGSVNEELQSYDVKVDITPPEVKDLMPANKSTFYGNNVVIYAFLDELDHRNSGIDMSSVKMILDGNPVSPDDVIPQGDEDASVTYDATPLAEGRHNVTINVSDKAGHSTNISWWFNVSTYMPMEITINNPQLDVTYGSRKVLIDVSLNKNADSLEYSMDGSYFKRLCLNCNRYAGEKSLSEGAHILVIKANNGVNSVTKTVSFSIDTLSPRIIRTEPKKGSYLNGTEFSVEFVENNVKEVKLYYGLNGIFTEVDVIDCELGRVNNCAYELDLKALGYPADRLEYYFTVADELRIVESKHVMVFVDMIAPEVTISSPVDEKLYGTGRITLSASVNEKTDMVYSLDGGKFMSLCRSCNTGERALNFRDGEHTLTVRATDKAGNYDTASLSFSIDSKAPRIRSTEPKKNSKQKEMVSFKINYDESNLNTVVLHYRQKDFGTWLDAPLKACPSGTNAFCSIELDLSSFNNKWVEYYFNVSDFVTSTNSKMNSFSVDAVAPSLEIMMPEEGVTLDDKNVMINVVVSNKELVNMEYSKDGEEFRTLCRNCVGYSSRKYFGGDYGGHTLTIRATDGAGNQDVESVSFEIFEILPLTPE